MTDIYSWILSPEIRDYLRGNYRPTLMERQAMIRGAYKPIEEKLSALQELLGEAETEGERIFLTGPGIDVSNMALAEFLL